MATSAFLVFLALAVGVASDATADGVCQAGAKCGATEQGDHLLLQVKHAKMTQDSGARGPMGYPGTGNFVHSHEWCQGEVPTSGWSLASAHAEGNSLKVKVLSYNLFWWNLFGQRHGNGNSAGHLIADHQDPVYDLMGFQECDDVNRILNDARAAGLSGEYEAIAGLHALGIVYRSSSWELLDHGTDDVAEDDASQWYGNRGAQWARLEHKASGKKVTLVNHHGPLPVGSGGRCGGEATAYNILRTVASHAEQGDAVVVVGDFNAGPGTATISNLEARLNLVTSGTVMGAIDHIFSTGTGSGRKLGLGGSDHEAIDAEIDI